MKQRILDTAAMLIQQYGLKKFTIDDIASELRISKKTIYKYFKSKNDIISEYFNQSISSGKDSIRDALAGQGSILEKLKVVVHSSHRYPLSVSLLNEVKRFYPEQWEKIDGLKTFKMQSMKNLLDEGVAEDVFREDINYAVFLRMLHEISDMFTDYDFLLQNRLKTSEAIDESLKIILYGAIKKQ